LNALAVVMEGPGQLALKRLPLGDPAPEEIVVDVDWSGISTGTERLLWSGKMPPFPGMGYPLVPGYESVGRIRAVGAKADARRVGETVFVPGARCFGEIRGLFGGSASRVVVSGEKAVPVSDALGDKGVLLALAATAYHSVSGGGRRDPIVPPDLIVGHGVLGRLLARLTVIADFPAPTVWETSPLRAAGAAGYPVLHPDEDRRRDYRHVYDVSGDSTILDRLVSRLAPGGEIVLAGFYSQPLAFSFAPAFMREAQIRVAAEWKRADMLAVREIADAGLLPLSDLITHHAAAGDCERAYRTAFEDSQCLKMVIDWTGHA